MRTNWKIYEEAIHIFRTENLFVRFTTNSGAVRHYPWVSQGLLCLVRGEGAARFRNCAMEVNHYRLQTWRYNEHNPYPCSKLKSTTFLLISDQLPNLLRTLTAHGQQGDERFAGSAFLVQIFDNSDRQFAKSQQGPLPVTSRIRHLLEPFKLLYQMNTLNIQGMVNEKYKQSIEASATRPAPTTAEIIETASAIKARGDEAFCTQKFDLALSLYTSAISDFQVNAHWAMRTGNVTTGEFARMSTPHAARLFQIRMQSSLAAALAKVGEYRRAIAHARESVRQILRRGDPVEEWVGLEIAASDDAKPFLWGGLAYEGIGDLNRAIYGVGEAFFHDPSRELKDEFRRLEAEFEKRGIEPATHELGKGTNWWTGAKL